MKVDRRTLDSTKVSTIQPDGTGEHREYRGYCSQGVCLTQYDYHSQQNNLILTELLQSLVMSELEARTLSLALAKVEGDNTPNSSSIRS